MRTKFSRNLFWSAATLLCGLSLNASALEVDIYRGFGTSGGGAPYSGLVGSFTSSDIQFATSTGYSWHPYNMSSFGADINGCINVPSLGNYLFSLDSDDGSMLYIDGNLVINNGGPHGPNTVSATTTLSAGTHHINVQFYEDFGGPSGVDLDLPKGVTYTNCPDGGSSLALLGGVIGLFGALGRRSRD